MTYSKKDIVTAISLMFFIITLAIVFTVFFKPLYYSDIYRLGIDISSGLDKDIIVKNYDALIQYQSIFYQGPLQLPNFTMSMAGRIHFAEVKRIFEVLQVMLIISGITSSILVFQQIRKKEYRFLRLTGILTIALPLLLAILVMMNFDMAFIIFHKLVFRNDFWIFDFTTDPIISILPQDFFMHCFIMIIVIIILFSTGCIVWYRYQQRRVIKAKEMESD